MTLVVLSQRESGGGLSSHLAYGAWNEAEDVMLTDGGARLVRLDRTPNTAGLRARRVAGRSVRRLAGQSVRLPAFASLPYGLSVGHYADGFPTGGVAGGGVEAVHIVFLAYGPWDLALLERLKELRGDVASISMWMPEVWPSTLADDRLRYEGYGLLDHLFVGVEEAVEPFRAIAPSVNVRCVPTAADVVVFGIGDVDAQRGIDVLGVGRRRVDQHSAILDWADRGSKLYLYDTVSGSVADWREHRRSLASLYRHSKVALCNYAKHDMPGVIGGLRVIPGRLFEGMAAGAVLVGMAPDESAQRRLLGVPVVESGEGSEVSALLDKLMSNGHVRRQRIRNATIAARGHDWAHRWRTILGEIGVPEPPGITKRIDTLAARAIEIEAMT